MWPQIGHNSQLENPSSRGRFFFIQVREFCVVRLWNHNPSPFFYWWNDKTETYESSMCVFQEGVTGIKRAALRSCWLIPGTKRIYLTCQQCEQTREEERSSSTHDRLTGCGEQGMALQCFEISLGYHWLLAVLARKQKDDLRMERFHLGLEIIQHRGFQTLLSLLSGVLYESQYVKTPSVRCEADLVEAKMEGMCGRSVSRNQGHVCVHSVIWLPVTWVFISSFCFLVVAVSKYLFF